MAVRGSSRSRQLDGPALETYRAYRAHMRSEVRRQYADCVGRPCGALPTPALLLDLATVRMNIAAMASWTRGHAAIRPHVKVHKSPEIARLQIDGGAVGITCATVAEALAMADAGLEDILVANEVLDPDKLRLLAQVARACRVTVALDSRAGADALSKAATRAGITMGAVIEIDIGMGRGGVRSPAEATRLGTYVTGRSAIALRGVIGWEGHVAIEPDRAVRAARANAAIDKLVACADGLRAIGVDVEVISAGGTNTYDLTGADSRITDIQAGTYALMDTSYLPFAPAFKPALSVLGTIVSRHGTRAVADCGTKVMAMGLAAPLIRHGSSLVAEVHEEHALLDIGGRDRLRAGDNVEFLVSYCAGTVNLHDAYLVVDDGRVFPKRGLTEY